MGVHQLCQTNGPFVVSRGSTHFREVTELVKGRKNKQPFQVLSAEAQVPGIVVHSVRGRAAAECGSGRGRDGVLPECSGAVQPLSGAVQ